MKIIKPFSENIIFLDTEFSNNSPKSVELLSIGLVKISGEELYLELEYEREVSDWVKENVLPFLKEEKVSKDKAIGLIKAFIGEEKPYAIAFVNVFDMVYCYELFGSIDKAPFAWPPIDFASILFANGINPENYYQDNKNNFFEEIGIDVTNFNEHNALDDANLLREVYLKLTL